MKITWKMHNSHRNRRRTGKQKTIIVMSAILFSILYSYQHEIMLFTLNYAPYHLVGYSYSEDELPKRPPEKPAPILLLHTYMRGGSSLLGSVFDRNPNVLYHFEPLYTMYQAALNTEHYSFEPLHLYAYPNGTLRDPTIFEEKIVFDRLFDLLDCKMDRLRMEHIASAFISRSQALRPYERCVGSFTIGQRNYCTALTGKRCGGFVHKAMENNCHISMAKILHDFTALKLLNMSYSIDDIHQDFHQDIHQENEFSFSAFDSPSKGYADYGRHNYINGKKYKKCLKDVNAKHQQCRKIFKERCENSHLRVAKLVRSNTNFLEKTLRSRNDVFVIYQTRDPRGRMNSKDMIEAMTFDIKTESNLECQILYKEYLKIQELKTKYPDRVFILKYEDLASDLLKWTKILYNFIGIEPPQTVFDSIETSIYSWEFINLPYSTIRNDGNITAWNWLKTMSPKNRQIVETACKDFFELKIYDLLV